MPDYIITANRHNNGQATVTLHHLHAHGYDNTIADINLPTDTIDDLCTALHDARGRALNHPPGTIEHPPGPYDNAWYDH